MTGLRHEITRIQGGTETAVIYIAGDYNMALEGVRIHCSANGDCWCVERCDYVYTGGQEAGVKLTRINYPRFPIEDAQDLQEQGEKMAEYVLHLLHQSSCTVVGPIRSVMLSRRADANE